ncbi:MAG: hypothetical protein PHQ52_05745, partial [Candidatus Omnitrophica bacterium]|nr:hypothetical protein [Candidatus Omnitrophota bacterium]
DIKAPLHKYNTITNTQVRLDLVQASIALIQTSGIAHEFRTTVVGGLISKDDDIEQMHKLVNFSDKYKLHQFRASSKLIDERFFAEEYSVSDSHMTHLRESLKGIQNTAYVQG